MGNICTVYESLIGTYDSCPHQTRPRSEDVHHSAANQRYRLEASGTGTGL